MPHDDDTTPFDDEGVSNGTTDDSPDPRAVPPARVTSRPDAVDPGENSETVDVDEELRKQARYEAIQTARGDAAEAIKTASVQVREKVANGTMREAEARELVVEVVRDRVRAYVLELEAYLTSLAAGRHYWSDLPLGRVEFPELEATIDTAGLGRGGGKTKTRRPDPVAVVGLGEFVEAPDRLTREVEVTDGSSTATDEASVVIPADVSRRAFRACNQFASDIGLDVEPDSGRPTFGTAEEDYR